MEKAVNIKAKVILQSSSSSRDMDSGCPRGNKPVKKEEKDFEKKKSTNSIPADSSSRK